MAGRLKLGQLLVAQGLIHPDQLAAALSAQEEGSARVGMALVQMGALEEEDLIRVLARQLGVKVARLGGKTVSAEILALVPADVAEKRRCLPLFLRDDDEGDLLVVGMEDPSDEEGLAEIAEHAGCRPHPVLIGPTELDAALARYYGGEDPDAPEDPLAGEGELPPLSAPAGAEPAEEAPDEPAPLPPSDWMEADAASASPGLDDTQPDFGDELFEGDEDMDLGGFPDLDETLDPLDDADPLAGLAADDEAALGDGDEDDLLAALDASFGAGAPPPGGAPADLAFADPDASWSEPAEDPSVANDPFGGEDPFADFEKEPFAADDAPVVDDTPTDPVAAELPAPPPRRADESERQAAIVQALAQLLVEKGVITREEFAARLRKLTHG